MENTIPREAIKRSLAEYYRDLYGRWFQLMNEATAAIHDGDDEAHQAISRRANKKSDFMDGIKAAAEILGIESDEFMDAVSADRLTDNPDA